MEAVLIRLAFFIAFTFYTFSSYAAAPIDQSEEGFRWRDRSHFVLGGTDYSDDSPQADHERMNTLETALSHYLPISSINRNIALACISIVFQTASGIRRVSDWVHPVEEVVREGSGSEPPPLPETKVLKNIAVFVSGQGTSLSSVREGEPLAFGEIAPSIQEVNGTDVILAGKFKSQLHSLFTHRAANLDDRIRLERLSDTSPRADLSAEDYHHSEQWLMIYLGLNRGPERGQKPVIFYLVDRLIEEKAREAGYVDGTTTPILAVILHIHSKNDLCDRCTHTLSQFSSKPNGLVAKLKGYINTTYYCAPPAFLIVASSRINSQGRRVLYGHDDHCTDRIDIGVFPAWFVQIALPDLPRPQRPLVRLPARAPAVAAAAGSRGGGDVSSSDGRHKRAERAAVAAPPSARRRAAPAAAAAAEAAKSDSEDEEDKEQE